MNEFPYATAEHESVPCNLCLGTDSEVFNTRDRNDLPVRSCICRRCGLMFISPRMTPKWYGEYYKTEYRAQMARFKREPVCEPDYDKQFASYTRHGGGLAERLRPYWQQGLTVEVGSSIGGVLNGLRQQLGGEVLGIEPSPSEAAEANRRGINTFAVPIESFREKIPAAANILCTQSLNHFLDPRFFLSWAHRNLEPNGRLVLEVMNFRHVFRHFGWMRRAIQIDHTYMFVPEVLSAFVQAAGFDVLHMESDETKTKEELRQSRKNGLPGFHVHLVASKAQREPFDNPTAIPSQYEPVLGSLTKLPNSHLRYYFKFEFKRRLKAWLRRK